jgi:hypothetical protein
MFTLKPVVLAAVWASAPPVFGTGELLKEKLSSTGEHPGVSNTFARQMPFLKIQLDFQEADIEPSNRSLSPFFDGHFCRLSEHLLQFSKLREVYIAAPLEPAHYRLAVQDPLELA